MVRPSAAALAAMLALAGAVAAAPGDPEPIVRAVELRSDVAVDRPEELLRWVAVEVGRPLSADAVAASLRNLHASGIAAQVEAHEVPLEDGIRLLFVLRGKVLVESVEWVGEQGLKDWRIRQALAIGAGDPLLADRIFRSVYGLQDLYTAEGYLDASIRVEVDADDRRRRAVVRFRIDSGEPATVGTIDFEGEIDPYPAQALRDVLRAKTGSRYFQKQAREDRERLERWLLDHGYRQAIVEGPKEEIVESRTVNVRYSVELGPRFVVKVVDGTELDKREKGLLPLSGVERYDDGTAERAEERLKTAYQERGYYAVEVEVTETVTDDAWELAVRVDPGSRRVLREVTLTGNEALTDARLKAVMQTAERRLLTADSGRLVDAWLAEDLAAIEALYALEGYADAVVGPPAVAPLDAEGLAVEIPIVEGERRTVGAIRFHGVERLEVDELLRDLPLRAGGPYHRRREEEALDLIRGRYAAAGFNLAQVTSALDWDGRHVDVAIDVLEGPRSTVQRVIVRGQRRTRPGFIRHVLDLEPGEPVSPGRLRELQRRLYGLGIFSRVDVRLVPGTPYSAGRDIIVEVREGRRQRLTYGLGYDSEDGVRGLLGYSHANLWGRAVSGRVDWRLSQRDRQVRALLRQPAVGRWRLPLTYSVFTIDEEQESFRSSRNGAQADVQLLRKNARWNLLLSYRTIEIDDPDAGLELLLVDREFREVAITSLTPSLFLDYRDDPVDPRRGWSATLLTEFAFPALDADEQFTKLFAQHTRYVPLGSGVLAGSLRAGAIEPRSGAGGTDPICAERGLDSPTCDVKISERFFAGGRTSHRAYARDRLGVLDETLLRVEGQDDPIPFGGAGLLLANFDYRFPIGGGLGGTVFVDGGNVWGDWRDVTGADVQWGAGLGVRYASPVGPVRLEIGWKLDRLPGEDPYVVLFSIGNPF